MTIVILVHLDSIERLENLLICTDSLLVSLGCKITVLEVGNYSNGILKKLLNKKVEYSFIEDKDDVLYISKYHNLLVQRAKTEYVGIWDSDIIIPAAQLSNLAKEIKIGKYDMIYPFDSGVLDVSFIIRKYFLENRDEKFLNKHQDKMRVMYSRDSKGGAVVIRKDKFISSGMQNESIYGWGQEDFELYEKFKVLNYKIKCIKGILYHLSHPRSNNSTFFKESHIKNSNKELFITKSSSENNLKKSKNYNI